MPEKDTWNEEKQENAYFLHNKHAFSNYYTSDIRAFFEDRYKYTFSDLFACRKLTGLYENELVQTMWEGFYNGFRACEDL